jgi:hypothetical protein
LERRMHIHLARQQHNRRRMPSILCLCRSDCCSTRLVYGHVSVIKKRKDHTGEIIFRVYYTVNNQPTDIVLQTMIRNSRRFFEPKRHTGNIDANVAPKTLP